jgi:hypothetical protein
MRCSIVSWRFLFRVAGVALWLATSARARATDVVLDWNAAVGACIESLAHSDVTRAAEARTYALMHLTLWEALRNAGPDDPVGKIAAATAAHDTLVIALPRGKERFAALLATHLASTRDTALRERGVAQGREVAEKIRRERMPAESTAPGRLSPATLLFALKRNSQFRADEPDHVAFGSARFNQNDFTRRIPRFTAEEKSAIVLLRARSPVVRWNRIAAAWWAERGGTTLERARAFALLGMALADACSASMESRAYYRTTHPTTIVVDPIIDHALTEAGPFAIDQHQQPLANHPSTSAALAGAAAAVLLWQAGGDAWHFSVPLATADMPSPTARAYIRITDAAKEHAIAGLLVGRETFAACVAGYDQGFKVGDYIVRHPPPAFSR